VNEAQVEAVGYRISRMKSDRLTLFAGLSLLLQPLFGFLYGALVPETTSSLVYPVPGLVLLPLFFIGPFAWLVPMVFFFVWNPGLFNGDAKTPKRTHVLLAVATLLSPLWFAGGWRDGIVVQGPRYNLFVLGINIVWVTVLWFMFVRNWKTEPSFKLNLLLHWLLFFWLAWYAFPFFGEIT
jgi:hypothetical protein